jgi:hypothetical protein
MRTRRGILLGLAVVLFALATPLSAWGTVAAYGRIKYSNGTDCGASQCEFVVTDLTRNVTHIAATGSLTTYNSGHFCIVISYPNGNTLQCISFLANAFTNDDIYMQNGDSMIAYGRQACPGGGYHISPVHSWSYNPNYVWWGGAFQVGSGCQSARPVGLGIFTP